MPANKDEPLDDQQSWREQTWMGGEQVVRGRDKTVPGAWFYSGPPVRSLGAPRLSTGQTVGSHLIGAWAPAGSRDPPSKLRFGRSAALTTGVNPRSLQEKATEHVECHLVGSVDGV